MLQQLVGSPRIRADFAPGAVELRAIHQVVDEQRMELDRPIDRARCLFEPPAALALIVRSYGPDPFEVPRGQPQSVAPRIGLEGESVEIQTFVEALLAEVGLANFEHHVGTDRTQTAALDED